MDHPTELFRLEEDSLGEISVPANALWGAQTERARQNFTITGIAIGEFEPMIIALAMIKLAAARSNRQLGRLSVEKFRLIETACIDLTAGRHREAFPVDAIQGGAGTSTNMNVNEVIANLANEMAGHPRGSYGLVHPNDDVNASQSTNDVYPTAIKLSLLLAAPDLQGALDRLATSFEERGKAFKDIIKLGRTQLQDAVPMTLGQEFAAFAATIRKDIAALGPALNGLYEINLGGTAIGTGLNAPEGYADAVLGELSAIAQLPLRRADDLIEASSDMGGFVSFSGWLRRVAVKLSKIANDMRLLSSGPRGGLGEIHLPQMQPGSSIMPGKVNPVIPEVVNQVCFQVIGLDTAVTMAAEAGQLQLNAMEPLIAYDLHNALGLLTQAVTTFAERCVDGIVADEQRCRHHLERSVAVATALVPVIGYRRSALLAKEALAGDSTVLDLAKARDWLPAEGLAELDLLKLAMPGRK